MLCFVDFHGDRKILIAKNHLVSVIEGTNKGCLLTTSNGDDYRVNLTLEEVLRIYNEGE
jgi:hypothetical protein